MFHNLQQFLTAMAYSDNSPPAVRLWIRRLMNLRLTSTYRPSQGLLQNLHQMCLKETQCTVESRCDCEEKSMAAMARHSTLGNWGIPHSSPPSTHRTSSSSYRSAKTLWLSRLLDIFEQSRYEQYCNWGPRQHTESRFPTICRSKVRNHRIRSTFFKFWGWSDLCLVV